MNAIAGEEQINGIVERVVYHSEETGFSVMRVKVRGHRELIAVIGTLPNITAGEWVSAHGRWQMDSKHGQQFKANSLRTTAPDTTEGIEKYLGSGLIKGIGPVYAKKLVEKFGKGVFDVIEKQSGLLERIDGIGPMRRKKIKDAWNEQKSVREIMTFLFSHGVSTSRAFRIYKTYGEQAVEIVQRNPYCLARDIRGIGFKTADQIAMQVGVEKESDLRAQAGVGYVLQQLTNDGHCAYPLDGLIEKSVEVLEIPSAIVREAIDHELRKDRLVRGHLDGHTPLIYLAPLFSAELELAGHIVRLAKGSHPCPVIDIEKAIPWVEGKIGMELVPSQRETISRALVSKVMVITGGPGVGKTTLVNAILRILCAKNLKPVLCAPTGRAAKRLHETSGHRAKTIHRLLAFDPKSGEFKHNRSHPLGGDVFIVDEASMIDVVLANNLIQSIPEHGALILVGDIDQLPSVGPGRVLRDIIESDSVEVCRLNEVFRQAAQSAIVTNAHRINRGSLPQLTDSKGSDSDFYFVDVEEPEEAAQKIVRLIKDAIPRRFGLNPITDIQVLSPMQRGELGARSLNQRLQQALNPTGQGIERFGQTFRPGDKVMQVQNDYDKDVYNGDIGRVRSLDFEEMVLIAEFEGKEVSYDFQELDELMLSYATTIHKSQGSEYPCVIVPIHTQHYVMLQRNLMYTAITRGRRLVVLVGSAKAVAIAARRIDTHQRITTLKERLMESATLERLSIP